MNRLGSKHWNFPASLADYHFVAVAGLQLGSPHSALQANFQLPLVTRVFAGVCAA
ncbi:MAG: hypothetical protein WCG03_01875 [Kiritimatiellales bacterium]